MIDATVSKKIKEKYEIKEFPKLKFVMPDKTSYTYDGEKSAEHIVDYLQKKHRPATKAVACDDVDTVTTGMLNLVYFGRERGAWWDLVQKIGKHEAAFYWELFHTSGECAEKYGISRQPGIAMLRHFDEPVVFYDGPINVVDFVKWMEKERIPSVSEFVDEYVDPIFKDSKPATILFHPLKESALHTAFTETARHYKGNEH